VWGSNGWFLKSGARGSGGRGSQRTLTARATFAGLDLLAELDLQPRTVRIQGNPVTLTPADTNVILVDEVDGPNLRVLATLKKLTRRSRRSGRSNRCSTSPPSFWHFSSVTRRARTPQFKRSRIAVARGLR